LTVFGKIQTSTSTFIARLTRFHLIYLTSIQNPYRISTDPWGFITVPISIPMGIPMGSPYPRQPWHTYIKFMQLGRQQSVECIPTPRYTRWQTDWRTARPR